jgi:hypothetical protein
MHKVALGQRTQAQAPPPCARRRAEAGTQRVHHGALRRRERAIIQPGQTRTAAQGLQGRAQRRAHRAADDHAAEHRQDLHRVARVAGAQVVCKLHRSHVAGNQAQIGQGK